MKGCNHCWHQETKIVTYKKQNCRREPQIVDKTGFAFECCHCGEREDRWVDYDKDIPETQL